MQSNHNQEFEEQGGAATMDPTPLRRWLSSRVITRLCKPEGLHKQRVRCEAQRKSSGSAHVVEYFHQVDDGYSHLAAQILNRFCQRYDIDLVCHLVRGPSGKNAPEPDLLLQLARYDAAQIAKGYGVEFPADSDAPSEALVALATGILAAQDSPRFLELVVPVGEAMWSGDEARLRELSTAYGCANPSEWQAKLDSGTNRRATLGHYSGAMFYYGREWYWGLDRLCHLEQRLTELGADGESGSPALTLRPPANPGPLKDDGRLTLEIYPSLRSPYTAIVFDRALALAEQAGVSLRVRPVLPMVMRGVSLSRNKGFYIFRDTVREAELAGVEFGRFYDPIGEPVRRCYALYPWACEQGCGNALISSFLAAAFRQGINTNNDRGLRRVVEAAGLSWREARKHLDDSTWKEMLERNRRAMYDAGLWGVPSFRLLDEDSKQLLAVWGQDRLWLVAEAIQRQLIRRSDGDVTER